MAAEFDFDLWLVSAHLSSDSVDKLVRVKVCDLDSLCLLSQYDITALKFEIGDRGKFRRALRKLREQYPEEDDDVLNASTSTKPDDSYDATDPDQVALQERLTKEQTRRDLAAQLPSSSGNAQLPDGVSSQVAAPFNFGVSSQVSAPLLVGVPSQGVISTASVDQLSTLLASMNLKLSSATPQAVSHSQNLPFALADPPQSLQHLITNQGVSPDYSANAAPTLSTGAALGSRPFLQLPTSSPVVPFTTLAPLVTGQDTATTASLAAHPGLKHISNLSIDSTVKDILGIQECGLNGAVKKGEKPLLPVDYITVLPGVSSSEEDVLNEHNGIELVLRSAGSRKPSADKLSTGQFI
jgi:hypothetical protein